MNEREKAVQRREIFGVFEVKPEGYKPKVVFCVPISKADANEDTNRVPQPHPACVQSLKDSIPLIVAAGWDEGFTRTVGNPYISGARADMTRQALDAKPDAIIYIDYDLSWRPTDLLKLLLTEGDVVAGTYRVKEEKEQYMGAIVCNPDMTPLCREDGCIKAKAVPAGFLKVTSAAIDKFMIAYPELCYGPQYRLSIDLFHHGAHQGMWWGEDYAFSRNWLDCGGDIWIVPDLSINHHSAEKEWPGNYHEFLLKQPGGSEDPARLEAMAV